MLNIWLRTWSIAYFYNSFFFILFIYWKEDYCCWSWVLDASMSSLHVCSCVALGSMLIAAGLGCVLVLLINYPLGVEICFLHWSWPTHSFVVSRNCCSSWLFSLVWCCSCLYIFNFNEIKKKDYLCNLSCVYSKICN